MPHLIHAIFSLVSSVLFFVVALLLVVADHELEPMSRSLLAAPHSMAELRMLLCKTVITCADILLRPAPHIQVAVYAACCVLMLWYQLRWVSPQQLGTRTRALGASILQFACNGLDA
jgi:predicted secreted protein